MDKQPICNVFSVVNGIRFDFYDDGIVGIEILGDNDVVTIEQLERIISLAKRIRDAN